jgi:hypothetical protein
LKTFPCPKCGRLLKQSGEVTVMPAGKVIPTFQCDECLVTADFCGEPFEMALTFALDESGQPFDPAAADGRLRLD